MYFKNTASMQFICAKSSHIFGYQRSFPNRYSYHVFILILLKINFLDTFDAKSCMSLYI
jgi:hypothetical protein